MKALIASITVGLTCIGCTPAYTPLSYSTADIEPTVSCAKFVFPCGCGTPAKGWGVADREPRDQ